MTEALKIRKTFYWYDGPLLFTASHEGHLFLAIAVGKPTADHDQMLMVHVSHKRCADLEAGRITIRQALKFPERKIRGYKYYDVNYETFDMSTAKPIDRGEALKMHDNDWFIGGYNWWLTPRGKQLRRRYRDGKIDRKTFNRLLTRT